MLFGATSDPPPVPRPKAGATHRPEAAPAKPSVPPARPATKRPSAPPAAPPPPPPAPKPVAVAKPFDEPTVDDAPLAIASVPPAPEPPPPAEAEPNAPAKAPSSPAPPSVPVELRSISGLALDKVDAFVDLPHAPQRLLSTTAHFYDLEIEEEVPVGGAVVVITGGAAVCAAVSDSAGAQVGIGKLVPGLVSLEDATRIRVVATEPTRVATWDRAALQDALKACPWVLDELRSTSDRFSALAGATMGPLGDLDEFSRLAALDRLTLRVLAPNEVLTEASGELPGFTIVGGGLVVVERDEPLEFSAGDIVLPETVLEGGEAGGRVRAGGQGAAILFANRMVTVELFSILPSLVELLRVV